MTCHIPISKNQNVESQRHSTVVGKNLGILAFFKTIERKIRVCKIAGFEINLSIL